MTVVEMYFPRHSLAACSFCALALEPLCRWEADDFQDIYSERHVYSNTSSNYDANAHVNSAFLH